METEIDPHADVQEVAQKLHELLRSEDVRMGVAVSALSVVLGTALGHVAREDSAQTAQAVLVNIVDACLRDIKQATLALAAEAPVGTIH